MSGNSQAPSFGTVFHPEPDLDTSGGRLPGPPQLRRLPRRRRPGMVALAGLLVCVGVLGSVALYQRQNHQVSVLVVTADVPAGSVISAADIGTTSVAAGPGVQVIPARQYQQVVGLVAATALRPGTLLAASELTRAQPPATGQALVPVAVRPSAIPAGGLSPGDQLLIVPTSGTPGTGTSAGGAGPPILTKPVAAIVQQVSTGPNQDGLVVIDLLVSYGEGVPVAQQAATGDIALVITHRGQ